MTRLTRLDAHPTVRAARARPAPAPPAVLDAGELRALCLDAGADDVGFVEIERPALADQRADIEAAFPRPRALISFVARTNREAIRSPARSVGNLEFHQTYDRTNETAREIVTALERRGVRALNPSVGFPMEMDRWPGKIWVVGHKPVAVEAGLGRMGIHRNVIHPRFGNFILLATLVVDTPVSAFTNGPWAKSSPRAAAGARPPRGRRPDRRTWGGGWASARRRRCWPTGWSAPGTCSGARTRPTGGDASWCRPRRQAGRSGRCWNR